MKLDIVNPYFVIEELKAENAKLKKENQSKEKKIEKLNNDLDKLKKEGE